MVTGMAAARGYRKQSRRENSGESQDIGLTPSPLLSYRRKLINETGYPFDSANHEEEVVWGGLPCPRPVPLAGLLGGRTRASAAVQGDRPTSAPNKSWLSQMDTQFN